jgi:hypothetical protein
MRHYQSDTVTTIIFAVQGVVCFVMAYLNRAESRRRERALFSVSSPLLLVAGSMFLAISVLGLFVSGIIVFPR